MNQTLTWGYFIVLHQLVLELTGNSKRSAYSEYSYSLNEDIFLEQCQSSNNFKTSCRLIARKRKFVAFYSGNIDRAREVFELEPSFTQADGGGFPILAIINAFIDGLLGFTLARKKRKDEAKWLNVGLDSIKLLEKWSRRCAWNFSNKLALLEAEHHYYKGCDQMALNSYQTSICVARKHHFIHEEGLAEEKLATFLCRKNQPDDALCHFINAKTCYTNWGAKLLVERVDKAMAILIPLCNSRPPTH